MIAIFSSYPKLICGHSAAFRRYFKTDMQSDSGIAIIKELKEFATTYPGLLSAYWGDEVKIHNQAFLPMMTKWTDLGLKTIGWEPGGNLQPHNPPALDGWATGYYQ
jgi:hypothetical protein